MSTSQSAKTLLTETRDLMWRLHYSIHTERAYCDWIACVVRFHHMQARETLLAGPEKKVEDYLIYLTMQADVAAARAHTFRHGFTVRYGYSHASGVVRT